MSDITRDPILGTDVTLGADERLLATFRADPLTYWRGHLILAVLCGALAGLALVWAGNPDPWVGPVAALLAIGVRAAYLRSEALAAEWRLTDRRLIGPGGRVIRLADVEAARPFFGDVQVVTRAGDKHLLKYMRDAADVVAAITDARNGKRKGRI